nr:toll/interleukin-1 receptor domain-containing protein [Ktedonobacteraceae bacterium]
TLFDELRKHLSKLRRLDLIEIWYDSAIIVGYNFKDIIKAHISKADIIVLLVSADFFDSDQCFNVEMPYANEQHLSRNVPIIPVLLRPADLQDPPLEKYSLLPQNGQAITVWDNLDLALTEVAQGIHRVVKEITSRLSNIISVRRPRFPLSNLAYRRNLFFTDRDNILEALHHTFTSEHTPQTQMQALYGPVGIGKTHIAIEYMYRHQQEYQTTLWLNASPPELLSAHVLALAD